MSWKIPSLLAAAAGLMIVGFTAPASADAGYEQSDPSQRVGRHQERYHYSDRYSDDPYADAFAYYDGRTYGHHTYDFYAPRPGYFIGPRPVPRFGYPLRRHFPHPYRYRRGFRY